MTTPSSSPESLPPSEADETRVTYQMEDAGGERIELIRNPDRPPDVARLRATASLPSCAIDYTLLPTRT